MTFHFDLRNLLPRSVWQTFRSALPAAVTIAATLTLGACATSEFHALAEKPHTWATPEVLVAPSSFHGVHGLAIDAKGRLLAGTVLGNDMWEVDRKTGEAKVYISAPIGQADDIAVGPKGELAWTSYLQGIVRYRENDGAPIRELVKGLPGVNSIAFDMKSGSLYVSQVFLGDALWEIDVAGKTAPRLIAKDLGGLNGFEVGNDGLIYGPLWFKNQVIKLDPKNGQITMINAEFKTPAASNLDGKGNLWVVDTSTGELSKVELASGRKTVFKQLATALDNLAIAADGTVYVSNMADNGIQAVDPTTGVVTQLTRGSVSVPAGLKLDGNILWIADVFAFRGIDVKTGKVQDVYRMQASDIEYPFSVGMSSKHLALSSWFTGTVQLLDRSTRKSLEVVHGFKAPMDAIPMDDGSLIVAELATGSIVRAYGEHYRERSVVVKGLQGPVQMVLGRDRALYLTEVAGTLSRIDLSTGERKVLASGLGLPEGLAETPWGTFVVAESAARRISEVEPATGERRTVAEGLPIGLEPGPGLPPPYVVTGIAVDADGTIYFSADRNNSVMRVRPQR